MFGKKRNKQPEFTDPITPEVRNAITVEISAAEEAIQRLDTEREVLDEASSRPGFNLDEYDDQTQYLELTRQRLVEKRDVLLSRLDRVNSGLAKIALDN